MAARPPAIGLARGSLKSGNGGDRHPLYGRDNGFRFTGLCAAITFNAMRSMRVSLFVLIRLRHFT